MSLLILTFVCNDCGRINTESVPILDGLRDNVHKTYPNAAYPDVPCPACNDRRNRRNARAGGSHV